MTKKIARTAISFDELSGAAARVRAAEIEFNAALEEAEKLEMRVEFKTEMLYPEQQTGGGGYEYSKPTTKRLTVKRIVLEI